MHVRKFFFRPEAEWTGASSTLTSSPSLANASRGKKNYSDFPPISKTHAIQKTLKYCVGCPFANRREKKYQSRVKNTMV